jgi:hypothetical protein
LTLTKRVTYQFNPHGNTKEDFMDMVAFYEGWLGACREMQKFLDSLETKDMFVREQIKALSAMRIALIEVQTQPVVPRREPNNDD